MPPVPVEYPDGGIQARVSTIYLQAELEKWEKDKVLLKTSYN